jgi:hypothetical protein
MALVREGRTLASALQPRKLVLKLVEWLRVLGMG